VSSSNSMVTAPAGATTTYAVSGSSSTRIMASRRRLFARFRRTALPTRRDATIPTCGGPISAGVRITVIPPERLVSPVRRTAANRSAGLSETNGRPCSGSELPPALEATTLDHGAPGTGPHAGTESVLPLAPSHVGLIGTLHGEVSPIGRSQSDREDSGRRDSTPIAVLSRLMRRERELPLRTAKFRHRPRNIAASDLCENRWSIEGLPFSPNRRSPSVARLSAGRRLVPSRLTAGFPRFADDFPVLIYSPPSCVIVRTSPETDSGRDGVVSSGRNQSKDFSPHPVDRCVDRR
jgi:hypothetical protein